ncbi:MCE family protein [Nocardioides sp. WS12]|uniref:MCE family protein n=1 Tax=Nocardioides sp. WS12 TaxID=2486272 RepID=UPI0015FABD64|nr:MCE family protein [Nocardioides sp. WS12]
MTTRAKSRLKALRSGRGLVTALVVVALVGGILLWTRDTTSTVVQARFTSAEGLNVGDDVKVLGVRVGEIAEIENDDEGVLVTLEVDADQPIPADAHAAIVSPSLVSGRFVQFDPVYTGGDRMQDGDVVDLDRTAVPVTFDDVKQQLTDLATTLGPDEGKKSGPLAVAITSLENALENGNSTQLRTSITELRGAATALSDGRSDLFSTIENLNTFTRNLALNDAAVRGFTTELDDVSAVLASNKTNLSGAIKDLATVLAATETYFKKHGGQLTSSITDLNTLAATLADRSNELAGVLHVAPHSLIGLHNVIQDQAITGRATATNFDSVSQLLCGALLGAGGTSEDCIKALDPLMGLLGVLPGGDTGGLPLVGGTGGTE